MAERPYMHLSLAIVLSAPLLFAAAAKTDPVEQGRPIYRSNCAFCHGLTGLGGRGPDLVTGERKSDAEVKKIIREGVPGTTMPSFGGFEEAELESLVAFIKHLAGGAPTVQAVTGDAARGQQVYARTGCASCHQIGQQGSVYGPALTRVGNARPVHYLMDSLVEPSSDVPPTWEGVTVVTKDGETIRGVRINEDTFTVQLRLPSQQFRSFMKSDLREVRRETQSLMPSYKHLPRKDLEDLVAYMTTLRGQADSGKAVRQAEGIR